MVDGFNSSSVMNSPSSSGTWRSLEYESSCTEKLRATILTGQFVVRLFAACAVVIVVVHVIKTFTAGISIREW